MDENYETIREGVASFSVAAMARSSPCYGFVVLGNYSRLELRINRLERKLDLIMQHLKIEDPGALDFTEIDDLLRRDKKIEAVKRFRELDPAASLKEAVDAVEARAKTL